MIKCGLQNLEPLPSVILALAEQRSLSAVLETIIQVVARQPGVALARLWLKESAGECPVCGKRDEGEGLLHLRASAGASVTGADWSRINGSFHTVDLSKSKLKIAHMAHTYEVSVQFHCCGSPVVLAATLAMDAVIPNFIIHEYVGTTDAPGNRALVTPDIRIANGSFAVPEGPGLGADPDPAVLRAWGSFT